MDGLQAEQDERTTPPPWKHGQGAPDLPSPPSISQAAHTADWQVPTLTFRYCGKAATIGQTSVLAGRHACDVNHVLICEECYAAQSQLRPSSPSRESSSAVTKLIGGVGWEPRMLVASRVVKLSNPPCAIAGIVQGAQCGLRGVRLSR